MAFPPSQNSGEHVAKPRAGDPEQECQLDLPVAQPEQGQANADDDGGEELDAHPVGPSQAAGISGLFELGVGTRDQPAGVATAGHPRESLHQRAQDALGEGLLELHLLEALRLHHELFETLLDDILPLPTRETPGEEDDGEGGQAGDDEDGGRHRYQTLMSTIRRMNT